MALNEKVVQLKAKYNMDMSQPEAELKALEQQLIRIDQLQRAASAKPGQRVDGVRHTKKSIAEAAAELKKLQGAYTSIDKAIEEIVKQHKLLTRVVKEMYAEIKQREKDLDSQRDAAHKRQQGRLRDEEKTQKEKDRREVERIRAVDAADKARHQAEMRRINEEALAKRRANEEDTRAKLNQIRLTKAQTVAAGGARQTAWQRGPNRFGGVAGMAQLPGGGLTTGILGMTGANLYGAGAIGLAGVGARSAMEAYAESYNLKVMLAGVIQTFGEFRDKTGKVVEGIEKYEKSRAFSEDLYQRLRRKAADSPVTFQDLSQGYLVAAPYLAKSGLSFDQSLDVTNLIVTLGKMQNLPLKSIVDDIRALSTGRLTNAQTLQSMGFTKEDMGQLKNLKGDDLYNFLMEKGAGFREAMKEFEGSFTVAWDRMLDAFYTMRITLGERLAGPLSDFARNITATLNRWEVDGTLDKFASQAERLMEWGGKIMTFLIENFEAVLTTIQTYIGVKMVNALVAALAQMLLAGRATLAGGAGANALGGAAAGAGGGLLGALARGGLTGLASNPVGAAIVGGGLVVGGLMWMDTRGQEMEAERKRYSEIADSFVNNPSEEGMKAATAAHLREYLKSGKRPNVPTNAEIEAVTTKEAMTAFLQKYQLGAGLAAREIDNAERLRADPARDALGAMLDPLGIKVPPNKRHTVKSLVPVYPDFNNENAIRSYLAQHGKSATVSASTATRFGAGRGDYDDTLGAKFSLLPRNVQDGIIKEIARTKSFSILRNFTPQQKQVDIAPGATAHYGNPTTDKSADMAKARQHLEARIATLDPTPGVVGVPTTPDPPKKGTGGGPSTVTMEPDYTTQTTAIGRLEMENDAIGFRLGRTRASEYQTRVALVRQRNANQRRIAELNDEIAQKKASKEVVTVGQGSAISGNITGGGVKGWKTNKGGNVPFNPFGGGVEITRNDLKVVNKEAKDANKKAEASIELQRTLQQLGFDLTEQIEKYWTEYTAYLEQMRQGRLDMRQAILQLARAKDFSSSDPNRAYSAGLASLQIEAERIHGKVGGAGVAGAVGRMLSFATPAGLNLFGKFNEMTTNRDKLLQEQREKEYADKVRKSLETSTTQFKEYAGGIGLSGFELEQYKLSTKIQKYEQMLGSDNPAMHTTAKVALEVLYKLRSSIEKNTEAIDKQTNLRLSRLTESIFNTGDRLSPTAQYRKQFDDAMGSVDNMSDDEVRKAFSSIPFVGEGMANRLPPSILRNMMKLNKAGGFSNAGFQGAMYRERGMGMVSAMVGALSSGQDPLQALLGVKGKGPGDDAMGRLVESLFSGGVYRNKDGTRNKGGFSNDLISGGGSFLANLMVQQGVFGKNNHSNEGSQVGGMLASMGLFAKLGAFAGPVGILGGALIGSLFGKKRPEDPSIAQHRRNLEDLLKTISNRLKPQEDFYRTIRGDAVWGSASRMYSGRTSTLGARTSLGVL